MAIAEQLLAARFNTAEHEIVDHHTYALVSDGDLMEGVSHEAASLAGHLRLGKIVFFYDDNKITIEGSTDIAFTEHAEKRFEAYGWHVLGVDGHDRPRSVAGTSLQAFRQRALAGALYAARRGTRRGRRACKLLPLP